MSQKVYHVLLRILLHSSRTHELKTTLRVCPWVVRRIEEYQNDVH